ncbi:RNA-directed DNA polymerase (reverse transcriptase) [Trifolium pratense]|uniref:RNA-directed DNA polymerase (Reverse transcriptase) n=1 Tax=Trifolium pratense TaxID=57577 RepID=A0A2K3PE66_TRIPR|nr:RNA-directed DNA polymerase (reverse transcriptase) [Trifolium pratense]
MNDVSRDVVVWPAMVMNSVMAMNDNFVDGDDDLKMITLREEILQHTGFTQANSLGRYLGANLAPGRSRITLSKSVLGTIPYYHMQYATIPKTICEEVDKIQRDFVWGDSDQGTKIRLQIGDSHSTNFWLDKWSPNKGALISIANQDYIITTLSVSDALTTSGDWDHDFLMNNSPAYNVSHILALPAPTDVDGLDIIGWEGTIT